MKFIVKQKEEMISNVLGCIHTAIISLSCIAGYIVSSYCMTEYISILKPLLITCSIMIVNVLLCNIIERDLKKKAVIKIENSEEYRNLISETNDKEEKLVEIQEKISKLEKECNEIELKIYKQISCKDKDIEKIVCLPAEKTKNKPLIKTRIK